jgi:Ni2+-binding GTPase involved in maturation of urease and hydrogenase
VVVVLSGEEGAGKTTLLTRTLGLLDAPGVAVVHANAPQDGPLHQIAGVPAIDAPQGHWRSGLRRAVARLVGARLVLVEDLDGPCDPEVDAGEDLRVVIVDARDAHGVPQWTLRRASAVVIARADDADPATVAAAADALARPDRPVFVTAAGHDDRGLEEWAAWLARRVGEAGAGGAR